MDEALRRGTEMMRRFDESFRLGIEALQQNRLGDADAYLEEAVALSFTMANAEPRPDILWGHAVARFQLGLNLVNLGAHPEAIPHLEEAVALERQLASWNPQVEAQLPTLLIQLAKAYRGPNGYAPMGRGPLLDVEEMRTYRIEQMQGGTWPRGMLTLVSDEQKAKAADPLNEAIPILRRLVCVDRAQREGELALALNLLGETYVESERFAEAEPPLREAEAMYRQLIQHDRAYQRMLTDTLQLLGRIPTVTATPVDRISALEELLPLLRAEGYITEQEKEVGVTLTKSAARDRYSKAVQDLYNLYRDSGLTAKADDLQGEFNRLLGESYKIRGG